MRTKTIRGTYGGSRHACDVLVCEMDTGSWYCVDGSCNVNFVADTLEDGVYVEELMDIDYFTWTSEITSEEELVTAVEA